jgi:hypothetical protein
MPSSAASFFVGLLVSSVGYLAFSYGGRARRIPQRIVGAVLMVLPWLVSEPWTLAAISALLLGLLWAAVQYGL